MGVLSRYLLLKFLNIPFVRRHFHNFLSNDERRIWLSRRIQSGFIVQYTGLSNYPTFTGDREFIFISRSKRERSKNVSLRVGDVVSLMEPNRADKDWAQKHPEPWNLTKRIAGFEGYCGHMKTCWRGAPQSKVIVPRGYCWVLGDNRSRSRDSRQFGPVPLEFLWGKVIWRLGPEAFSFIDHDPNYGATAIPQSQISTTGLPIRPDEDPKTPEPTVKLITRTIPPTITVPKPHLRYRVSDTKRQEPVHRSPSKRPKSSCPANRV